MTIGEKPNKKNIESLDLTQNLIFQGFDVKIFFCSLPDPNPYLRQCEQINILRIPQYTLARITIY